MTGQEEIFSDLDRSIVGSIKFSDGSVVSITGCGSVVFNTKDGARKVLSGMFLIPRLRKLENRAKSSSTTMSSAFAIDSNNSLPRFNAAPINYTCCTSTSCAL